MKKSPSMNRDLIKLFAMFTMTCNHAAHVFLPDGTPLWTFLTVIGYFTGPCMCYFLVEGMQYTRSPKRYAGRLLFAAFLSQFPFWYALSCAPGKPEHVFGLFTHYNMMFTLFLCSLICIIWRKTDMPEGKKKPLIFLLITASIVSDWAVMAPLYTVLLLMAKDRIALAEETAAQTGRPELARRIFQREILLAYFFAALILVAYAFGSGTFFTLGCFLIVMLVGLVIGFIYNGKRMKHGQEVWKWFFYLYYPSHLLIIGWLALR